MALSKYKLGSLIEKIDRKNTELLYAPEDARGVSAQKELIPTKADLNGRDISVFSVLKPNEFVFNRRTTRMGDRICVAYNNTDHTYILTEDYVLFFVKDEKTLLPVFLFMFFNRPEFDRYARFNSWGSATELFSWEDMCDIDIELPDLATQQKYVDIYNAMVANQQAYERGLEDLKLVCDGYIEDLRRKMPCEKIGPYIEKVEEKNTDGRLGVADVKSVNKDGTFAETVANVDKNRIDTYKIVCPNDFAYTNRINIGSIARRKADEGKCLVSASYDVFRITNTEKLLPEYLTSWIRRTEFFRYAGYHSIGSVKDNFSIDLMKEVEIPIPDIKVQKAISNIYTVYIQRKEINEKLKAQIKDICPVLIKGSLEEG